MPRDATSTRLRLIRAGERLFARKGIDGALTRDLVAEAEQGNDSAVNYHFGSRDGLLLAVVDKHVRRMEERWKPALGGRDRAADIPAIVAEIVDPIAGQLCVDDGRDFVRITAQLAGRAGIRTGYLSKAIAGTALSQWLGALERACAEFLPRAIARERVAMMVTMLTATLADRARRVDEGERMTVGHKTFVANLTAMLAAGVNAPSS
ncbi:TetR family transcriptional regulator [Sciscionella marina]|uniref:TetR family transcriptional regulator n=1 Tax=Sciscionella marina TaxID=508770 RepID=UPI00047719C5|nr:TetR family transcriptional regulator [Sciscionella marina]